MMDRKRFIGLVWLAYHQLSCLTREGDARRLRRTSAHYPTPLRRWVSLRRRGVGAGGTGWDGARLFRLLYSAADSRGVQRMLVACAAAEGWLFERLLSRLPPQRRVRMMMRLVGASSGPGLELGAMLRGDPSAVAEWNHAIARVLENAAGKAAAGEFIRLLALRHCLLGASRN